jgi:hypothetical protein
MADAGSGSARRGAAASAAIGTMIGLVGEMFPNTALLARQPRMLAARHPRGAHQTEV